jgi:hypothetical protein
MTRHDIKLLIKSGANIHQLCLERTVAHAGNSTFAIGGVSCSADNFVQTESFVLRIKFSGKNPAHRKSAKRWQQ